MRLVRLLSAVGFRSFWSADLCCLLYGSCVPSAGLSIVSCSHTKISISFGSYKSLREIYL